MFCAIFVIIWVLEAACWVCATWMSGRLAISCERRFCCRNSGEVVTTVPVIAVSGFSCPCHGGAYDTEGNRTAGPPVRGLDRYEFSIKNGHLILGRNYSVGSVDGSGAQARIHKYDLTGPGQHVKGWEQIFYPIQPPH